MGTRQAGGPNAVAAGATLNITGARGCVQISTLATRGAPHATVARA